MIKVFLNLQDELSLTFQDADGGQEETMGDPQLQ